MEGRTVEAALYDFFSGFDIPAFAAGDVPDGVDEQTFPYITYAAALGGWEDSAIAVTADIWYHTKSWVECNAKAKEIYDALGLGGVVLPCCGAAIWIKRGVPFAQSMDDPSDVMIRRKLLNLEIDFLF